MEEARSVNGGDLLEVSDRAIKAIVWQTLEDQRDIEALQEPKQSDLNSD